MTEIVQVKLVGFNIKNGFVCSSALYFCAICSVTVLAQAQVQ